MSVHQNKHWYMCVVFAFCLLKKSLKWSSLLKTSEGLFTFQCLGPTWPGSPHFSAPESPFPEVRPALSPANSVRSSAVSFVRRFTWEKLYWRRRQGTSPQYQYCYLGLSSDTICQLNQLLSNSEAAILSSGSCNIVTFSVWSPASGFSLASMALMCSLVLS